MGDNMVNKKCLFISVFLFIIVLSIGAVSAQDADDAIVSNSTTVVFADSGTVSGGVDVVTENPWNTTGVLSYDIPSDATTIRSADVYVNVYGGSAKNTYGANANITITAGDKNAEYSELLWIEEGSSDGTDYTVNDHTTKCYSDYMIHYDVTSMLDGLKGTDLNIDVSTFEMDIALVLAYDDGDDDVINYWINDDQLWSKTNVTITFDTDSVTDFTEASLVNVVLSSADGSYKFNDEFLGDADIHESGNYYQYNEWDVTDLIEPEQKTDLDVIYAGSSAYGSIKNALSVLVIGNGMDQDNIVSGGVDVVAVNPWNTTGMLSYDIPSDAISIRSADVYVNVYSGSAKNNYGANANITVKAGGKNAKYSEVLWTEEGSSDGTVYVVNDHTTKCYSDYMIHYDITSLVYGLNGTELSIDVSTFEMDNKTFDGRIKLIALVLAYDDGDNDFIGYWINDEQLWSKTNVTITFDTEDILWLTEADLVNVVLSSADGSYKLNDEFLGDADVHESGNYYQYNEWDVTDLIEPEQKTDLDVIYAGSSAYGSIKNALSVLIITNVITQENTVSGGVDVVAVNPWNTTGMLIYDIPSDATDIKSADVYVNVYSGSANNNYGANANITITAGDAIGKYSESLWTAEGSTDGTVYYVNDHTTKCYSDYMIYYNITDLLYGLNGTELNIDVSTFAMDGRQFDGRIKLIALVLAYDDGDDDLISYWINDDQLWSKTNVTVTFDTDDVTLFTDANLKNVVLSSGDGNYMINDEFLGDADVHETGTYYQYNEWNVTDVIEPTQKNDLNVFYAGTSAYGSIKNVLSVLTINRYAPEISIIPEYTSVPSAYAGTNNTLVINVKSTKPGNYTIKLYSDGDAVDEKNITLVEGTTGILLTDPTIRPLDASTVNGADNNLAMYTVELYYNDVLVTAQDASFPVLYNGNLGYDFEYNVTGFEEIAPITVTGDFVIDVKDASSYLSASAMNRTDNWAIDLNSKSTITDAFVYVPYNWFNAKSYTEGMDMFDVTFNGASVAPIAWYRDQSNLGNYGRYGYGVLIYNVSDLIGVGDNSFVLNKVNPTPAVYPSALIYMYNTAGSKITKTVSILNGADLLSVTNNVADRTVKSDTTIIAGSTEFDNAIFYVLAAGAQAYESDIVFNGNVYSDVWNGTSQTTDLFTADVTGLLDESNSISFVATGSTILALPQIIVTSKDIGINTALSAVYDSDAMKVIATLTNNVTGQPLKSATVKFSINGEKYAIKTNSKGQAEISTADLAPGTYTATVSYGGYNKYYPSKDSVKFIIKANTTVSADYNKDAKELVATLTNDATGQPIKGFTLRVKLDGVTYKLVTDANGQVKLSTADLAQGTYTATVTFNGGTKYNPSSTSIQVITSKDNVDILVEDLFNRYGDVELGAFLVNHENNQSVKGATVGFKINGTTYTAKTDANGLAKVTISGLAPDTYSVVVSYNGNSKYNRASKTITVVVNKISTHINAYYDSQSNEIVATLFNDYTFDYVKGGTVGFVINKVKTLVVTDAKGMARLSLDGYDLSSFKVTVSYAGNAKYFGSVRSVFGEVNKTATDISAAYDVEDNEIVVMVMNNETSQFIKGATVGIEINGVKNIVKTDANGFAKLAVDDLVPGAYVLTSSY